MLQMRPAQHNIKVILTWADLFRNSSMANKRMIMSQTQASLLPVSSAFLVEISGIEPLTS
jgi:hypothetical protein